MYKYQFNEVGTFYYYSGVVLANFGLAGTVVVTDSENYVSYLSLHVGDVEATYDTMSGVADPSDSSSCAPLLTVPAGCTEVRVRLRYCSVRT